MAISKLPPAPLGQPPGHSFWNDWYEKLRKIMEEITYQVTHVFAGIINTDNRLSIGVDTTDFIIIDDTLYGVVMKSPDGTYWKLQISNAGVATWANIGTTKP